MTLADNTLKVVRVDNNKTVIGCKNLDLKGVAEISSFDRTLIVPSGS